LASSRGFGGALAGVEAFGELEAVEDIEELGTRREEPAAQAASYGLRLTAALQAISAAQHAHAAPAAAKRAQAAQPSPSAPATVPGRARATLPAAPAGAGRGFGNARAASARYGAPALDLASDDEARPAPLPAEQRESLLEPVAPLAHADEPTAVTLEAVLEPAAQPADTDAAPTHATSTPKRSRSRTARSRSATDAAAPARRTRSRVAASDPDAPKATAAAEANDLADADGDTYDGLDFSAFPGVTEFGTPRQLSDAAASGVGSAASGAPADASATHPSPGMATQPQAQRGLRAFIAALDKLPPIRLPIGPAIPWRFGLPALVALLALTLVLNRPTAHAETQGVRLPASETYAVQEAPLFQKNAQAQTSQSGQSVNEAGQTSQPGEAAPVGVPDNAPTGGTDFLDILLKLVAVLALAYGSLSLLKRAGVGGAAGASSARHDATTSNVRVVTSLALAPNRSVHVLQVAGGKTLLLGATPTQVNLLADLGEVNLDTPGAEANFLDILTSKLGR
jgi:flagellar biogenesis protein FliO